MFANELLDAFPVHLATMTAEGLREIYVDLDEGELVERVGPLSTPELASCLDEAGVALAPGARAEINLLARAWVAEVAARLARGFLVVIDYGYEAEDLYSPRRAGGTLATFHRHGFDRRDPASPRTPSWLIDPGSRDITAHVDFTSLRRSGLREGFEVLGLADQMHALLGIAEQSGFLDALSRQDRLHDRLAFKTLIIPGGLGTTHSMMVLGKGVGRPQLMGFQGLASPGRPSPA